MQLNLGKRLATFGVVGISGILVNMGFLVILTHYAHFYYALASPIAIELAILNNFIWNDRFTWRGRRSVANASIWQGLLKFNLVSWIAGSINWILLIILTEVAGIYYLWGNLIAIAVASGINFILNEKWTFRQPNSSISG